MGAVIRNLPLDVYLDGADEPLEVLATTPDLIRWERKTHRKVSDLAESVGMDDLARIAWNALKRTGRVEDGYEAWLERVEWIAEREPEPVDPTPPGR